jgi:outer membrane lipoprotein-sorting protein
MLPASLFFAAWACVVGVPRESAPQKAPHPVQTVLTRLQKTYRAKTFQADFSQVYTDAVLGPKPAESGKLCASGDGRVRFDYAAPHTKQFVFDGNDAYFYEPDAAQVTVIEGFGEGPVAQAMALLWGQGALHKAFSAKACSQDCPAVGQDEQAFTLTPVAQMPGVQRIHLVVDKTRYEVHRTQLIDPLGNKTLYSLENRRLGQAMGKDTFVFAMPEGMSVLRTTLDGPNP